MDDDTEASVRTLTHTRTHTHTCTLVVRGLHCQFTPWSYAYSNVTKSPVQGCRRRQKAPDTHFHHSFFFFFFFFYLLSMKYLSWLRDSPRAKANKKFRDLHRPWSASPLFGLKWSCNRWSYFKALAAACPVLPISLSGNTESLIYCLAALPQPSSPFLLSVRTHKASLPRSIHLQMAYLLYREGTKYQRERKSDALSDTSSLTSQSP